jgi:hypothetical protein
MGVTRVMCINLHQFTIALSENVVPKVAFTGIPAYYHKDLKLVFGDYIEAYERTYDTSQPHTLASLVSSK